MNRRTPRKEKTPLFYRHCYFLPFCRPRVNILKSRLIYDSIVIRRYLSTTKDNFKQYPSRKIKKEHIIGVAVTFTEKETNSDGNTGEMRRRHLQTGTQREHQSANEWRVGCSKKCVIGCEIARVPSCHESSASDSHNIRVTTTSASRECTLDSMCIEK